MASQRVEALRARGRARQILVVLGDQLDLRSPGLARLDRRHDVVLMMEVAEEATHVWSHKQRTVLFLAAMRHYAIELAQRGYRVHYVRLDERGNTGTFAGEVARAIRRLKPERILAVWPGEWRVRHMVDTWAPQLGVPVEVLEDTHFLISRDEFAAWADGRKQLVLEHFYRMMRKKLGVLIAEEGEPTGGQWNFDADNRRAYREDDAPPNPRRFRPDDVTRAVMVLVARRFGDAPGSLDSFEWPVTRREAQAALRDFVEHRLPRFGDYQDAMTDGQAWMFHSLLSPALNLKLLSPSEVVAAVLRAYAAGDVPLNAAEGFVRQIIGWREFIRGVYWWAQSAYGLPPSDDGYALPLFYWSGATDMQCMRACIGQVLDHGYGHHIQRLMVTGNFALIAGASPRQINDWYQAMYVDAVDWVTAPNTVGMVMHADGGLVGTKPYAASGRYIQRMSDYCRGCRYRPEQRVGDDACPFTTFYWDYLLSNEHWLRKNPRMQMVLKNLARMDATEQERIGRRAVALRSEMGMHEDRGGA